MQLARRLCLLAVFLSLVLAISIPAVSGQVGIGVSPSVINMGAIAMNGTTSQTMRIYDTSNNTAINYTAQTNMTGVTVTPSSGQIAAKSNTSVTVTVNADTQQGVHSGYLIVNTSAANSGQVTVLPALAAKITYTTANYSAPPVATQGTNWLEIGSVIGLVVLEALIVVAVYMLKRR